MAVEQHQFCAVDVEGDAGDKGIIGCALYSNLMQEYLTDPRYILIALMKHAKEGYTFVCHNAGYDIPVLWHQLGQDVSVHSYNGSFHCGYWRYGRRRKAAHIWCSYALSGGSRLAELGESLGIPKLPIPARLSGADRDRYQWKCDRHNEWECVHCYGLRDAEISYTYSTTLSDLTHGWGIPLSPSLAGIAERLWQVLDQPGEVHIRSGKIERLSRSAFVGGRVECFKLGHLGPLWTADVRSAYLTTMAETPYPDPLNLHYWQNPRLSSIPWAAEGVLQGSVRVPPCSIPSLPYRRGSENMYPVGTLTGAWTLLELRYAQSVGCQVLSADAVTFSPHSVYPCPNFTSLMLTGRQEAEKDKSPMAVVFKVLGNALYGRWGMGDTTSRGLQRLETPHMKVKEMIGSQFRRCGEHYVWSKNEELAVRSGHRNVLWAAQTTAALRVKMHKFLLMQGDNVAYTDTDSVFSTAPIEGASNGQGHLEFEGLYERAIISGPKEYAFQHYASDMPESWLTDACTPHGRRGCDSCRWRARAKGVPRDLAVQFLRDGVVEFSKPVTLSQSARSGERAGTWKVVRRERQHVPYRRHPIDANALLLYDGWSPTQPPVIP